jgi:hypothetical protein
MVPGGMRRRLAGTALCLAVLVAAAVAPSGVAQTRLAAKVTVTFTDRTLRVSPTTPGSGPTTFVVANAGKKPHTLWVKGPGVKGVHTKKLAAGAHATLNVTLRPGAYTLSDPVGLGEYSVVFLDVVADASLSAKGDASVTGAAGGSSVMCGYQLTTP